LYGRLPTLRRCRARQRFRLRMVSTRSLGRSYGNYWILAALKTVDLNVTVQPMPLSGGCQ
jgi:hypothetical protein